MVRLGAPFRELRQSEVRRIPLLRTRVNKGMKKGRGLLDPGPLSLVQPSPQALSRTLRGLAPL